MILVPRETPLSLVHLRNLTLATEAGAIVLPAMPGFYHRPSTVQELVDFVVGKILDRLRIEHTLTRRWQTPPQSPPSTASTPYDEEELP